MSDLLTCTRGLVGVAALVLLGAAAAPAPAASTRSVTIIEGMPEPVAPAPSVPGAPTPVPLTASNPAGVAVEILPGPDLHVGTKIAFRVSTQRLGYLILIDVNAAGKLTQIYPNMMSLARLQGNATNANVIKPGGKVTIPDAKNPLARFQFLAEPPTGRGVVVAVVSDVPVQIIDLPELPPEVSDQQAILDFLANSVQALKITAPDDPTKTLDGGWSFAAKGYGIN